MKVELVNDLIARKIYEAASIDDKARAIANKFIQDRYTHFCRSKNMLLSRQELAFVQPYLNELVLDTKQKDYIERSKKRIKQTKKRKRLRDASLVALICIAILSSWGIWERHRYTTTHQHLAMAQDSIGVLLNDARNATNLEDYPTAPTTALIAFHTLHIQGKVTNTKGENIEAATIQVLGATVKSDQQGYYELHLVLPPKYWNEAPALYIKKEYYQEASHLLDVDKDQLEWNPVLEAKN
ncbi:MAG: hypothetical protein ACRBFS_06940 [Aureispira sp.]